MNSFDVFWSLLLVVLGAGSLWSKKHRPHHHVGVSCLFWACLSLFGVRSFFWEAYQTQGPSMQPTLGAHSWVVVNKQAYGWVWPWKRYLIQDYPPRISDIMAFQHHGQVWVKRVAATPGDFVYFSARTGWWVNGRWVAPTTPRSQSWLLHGGAPRQGEIDRQFSQRRVARQWYASQSWEVVVPAGFVFVLGDNLKHSTDSRDEGLISMSSVLGRVEWVPARGQKP